MNLDAVKNTMCTYTTLSIHSNENVSELESKLDALKKKLQDVRQNENLNPEKKKKQIQDLIKKIAELEKRIAQMKQKSNKNQQLQIQEIKEELEQKKASPNTLLDEYI